MKQLLYIAFIIIPFIGVSQDFEKKVTCGARIDLNQGLGFDPNSSFNVNGFTMHNPSYGENFRIDTAFTDTLVYEITLPFGDTLQYYAFWSAYNNCSLVDSTDVNSLVTILEGEPFPIIYGGIYENYQTFNFWQKAYIKYPCLFKIHRKDIPDITYFFHIKFSDPPQPETPLDLPDVTNDISCWLSNENTLTVKADQHVLWEVNFYSLSGQKIQTSQLEGSQNLDISSFPKGCYVARIISETGAEKHLKFIK